MLQLIQIPGGDFMNDWMKNIPDDFLLSEINLPGSHDSCTKKVKFSYFSKCQDLSVFEQLNIGIRFLDIRLEKTGNKLKTVHSFADCYKSPKGKENLLLDHVLNDCKTFLKANPSETVIISIKRDNGASSEETFDVFYENYLKNDPDWYKENRIPTLCEVRGKMVLINRCCVDNDDDFFTDNDTGLNFSGWPDQSKPTNYDYAVVPIPRRDGKTQEKYFLQDMYKLSPKNKWEKAILPLLREPPQESGIIFNFFSAVNLLHNPRNCSKYVFKRFLKYNLTPFKKYGWIVLDFPTEKICRKIILTNF